MIYWRSAFFFLSFPLSPVRIFNWKLVSDAFFLSISIVVDVSVRCFAPYLTANNLWVCVLLFKSFNNFIHSCYSFRTFFFLGKNPMDFPLNWIQGLWKLYSFNCTNAFHSSNFVNDFFSHTISSSSIRAWRFSGFPKTLMNWMSILQNSLKFCSFFRETAGNKSVRVILTDFKKPTWHYRQKNCSLYSELP